MKPGIYELFIAGALVALAGCSSGSPATPASSSTSTQSSESIDAKAVVETLKSGHVTVKVQSCISGTGAATFSAKGKAKGHVRGKFVVSGEWNFYSGAGQSFWTFAETFKIKGRHPITGTITGTGTDSVAKCKTFGPVSGGSELTYHLGQLSGAATTKLIKNGGTLLEQMH